MSASELTPEELNTGTVALLSSAEFKSELGSQHQKSSMLSVSPAELTNAASELAPEELNTGTLLSSAEFKVNQHELELEELNTLLCSAEFKVNQ